MLPVYRAGWQLIKVRAAMIASLVGAALMVWWGIHTAQTHGLNPGDGGVLAPLPERLAWGGLITSLGILAAAGMWLYGSHYAGRIDFDLDTQQIHLVTVGFFWNRHHLIHVAELGRVKSHDRVNWTTVAAAVAIGHPIALVHAPWISVRIAGWRFPLIIDKQGLVLHCRLMALLFCPVEADAAIC
jgi:hypothetical protein